MLTSFKASPSNSLYKGNISTSSLISFYLNELETKSKVIDLILVGQNTVTLFLEKTSFHPVDPYWPDQPADKGVLIIHNKVFNVLDSKILAIHKESKEIKDTTEVTKNEKNAFYYVVGHTIDNIDNDNVDFFLDSEVIARIDPDFRARINLHHTACHLSSLALNQVLKGFWRKTLDVTDIDSLGAPNFNKLANETSFIFSDRAEDVFRFGKSLKKKGGFQLEQFETNITEIQNNTNNLLRDWLCCDNKIEIITQGPHLDDTRMWVCDIPNIGRAEVPCGGTHVASLDCIKNIEINLSFYIDEASKERKLLMITTVHDNEK